MVSRRKRARLRYLRKWYARYTQTAPYVDQSNWAPPFYLENLSVLREAESDELQIYVIEARISEIQATVCVQNRICSECQHMLDTWPALEVQIEDLPYSLREYNTLSIEAGGRSGCEFCACVLQFLLDDKVLELCRKIECRLHTLRVRDASFLAIDTFGVEAVRRLRMTLPGLEYGLEGSKWISIDIESWVPATEPDSSK